MVTVNVTLTLVVLLLGVSLKAGWFAIGDLLQERGDLLGVSPLNTYATRPHPLKCPLVAGSASLNNGTYPLT